MGKKLTNIEFSEKASAIHNGKYDYSKLKYLNSHTKVCIVCPEHGEFYQTPSSHLNGRGCPICGCSLKSNTIEFIEKAKAIHNEKYDYSKVEYVNASTPVVIICREHGEFSQTPHNHLSGKGCPKCSKTYKPTTEEFIKKCISIFGEKYDYSLVEYINKNATIMVRCNACGNVFNITPHNHLIHKEGCPHCKQSKMESLINKVLEENNVLFEKQKVFSWLVNGKSVKKLDFYLPEYNVAIECQGLQHFKPVEYFGGEEYLERQKHNDEVKKNLCYEHGINVLYYSDINIDFPYEVITNTGDLMQKLKKAANKEK